MASVTRQMFTRCFVADDHNHSQSISENVNDSLHSGCIKFTDCNFTVLTPPVSSYHVSLELFRLLSRHLKKCDSFWCKYSPIIQGKDRQEAMGSGKRHVHSSCRRAEKAAPPHTQMPAERTTHSFNGRILIRGPLVTLEKTQMKAGPSPKDSLSRGMEPTEGARGASWVLMAGTAWDLWCLSLLLTHSAAWRQHHG